MKIVIGGLTFATLCLFIRCVAIPYGAIVRLLTRKLFSAVYRTIELADGWNGRVIETEVYFSALYPIYSLDTSS